MARGDSETDAMEVVLVRRSARKRTQNSAPPLEPAAPRRRAAPRSRHFVRCSAETERWTRGSTSPLLKLVENQSVSALSTAVFSRSVLFDPSLITDEERELLLAALPAMDRQELSVGGDPLRSGFVFQSWLSHFAELLAAGSLNRHSRMRWERTVKTITKNGGRCWWAEGRCQVRSLVAPTKYVACVTAHAATGTRGRRQSAFHAEIDIARTSTVFHSTAHDRHL